MLRPLFSVALALCSTWCLLAHAEDAPHAEDANSELQSWANRVIAAQQGLDLDRLVQQLVSSAVQDWALQLKPKFESRVPKARRPAVSAQLDVELQKFARDTQQIIYRKVGAVSYATFLPVYTERFTAEELKQLLAFLTSPVVQKYQSLAPGLGEQFVQQLIASVRPDIQIRGEAFHNAAIQIMAMRPKKP